MRRFWKDRWSNKSNPSETDQQKDIWMTWTAWINSFFGMANSIVNEQNPTVQWFKCFTGRVAWNTLPGKNAGFETLPIHNLPLWAVNWKILGLLLAAAAEAAHLLPYCQGVVKVFDSRQLCRATRTAVWSTSTCHVQLLRCSESDRHTNLG